MDLYNLGFIIVQYGWKPKLLNNFSLKSSISNFNKYCESLQNTWKIEFMILDKL